MMALKWRNIMKPPKKLKPGIYETVYGNAAEVNDWDDEQDEQAQGYCHFIQQGDWMEGGTMLLWDQCKECGVR